MKRNKGLKYFLITQERDNIDITEFDDLDGALEAKEQFECDYDDIQISVLIKGEKIE